MSDNLKERVRKIVSQRELCSYMNDTKWNELRSAMLNEMPFPPPFIVKFLFDSECIKETEFQKDVYYLGDWYYGLSLDGCCFNASFAIEWIKIRPRYLKRHGALIGPEIISAESDFVRILNKYNIPFVKNDGVYCIYGYR